LGALVHKPLDLLPEEDKNETSTSRSKKRLFSHPRTEQIFGTKRPYKRHGKGADKGRIRVGILDTGFEPSDIALVAFDPDDERIKGCWSFFNENGESDMIEEFKDQDGHGTHGATLILRVAPQAELFVARVFKARQDSTFGVEASNIHERIARVSNFPMSKYLTNPAKGNPPCCGRVGGRCYLNVLRLF
jgi:hypothetical protein